MKHATDFYTAFLQAFGRMKIRFDDAQWESRWTNTKDWSKLMIYDPDAVIRAVADSFDADLACWAERPYEPLHLDAVFHVKNSRSWFPIGVAIEHENAAHTFSDEIQKLLSVRCPLKVGITYSLISDGSQADLQARVEDEIRREFAAANALTQEDDTTEYLFLLGYEVTHRVLQWRKLIFNAAAGPAGQSFQ